MILPNSVDNSGSDSRCFQFVCLVKPPFDLQILMHFGQGNDFLPSVSVRASRNSASTSSVYVSKSVSDISRLKASFLCLSRPKSIQLRNPVRLYSQILSPVDFP